MNGAGGLFADLYGLLLVDDVAEPERRDDSEETQPEAEDLGETEALARVIASEAASHTLAEQIAVAWAVRNQARRRGVTIAKLVCSPTCGRCCEGRPFSSARAATPKLRELAAKILAAPQKSDPTGGAFKILEPALQDQLAAKEKLKPGAGGGHRKTADQVRGEWTKEGRRHLGTVGRWELWA